MTLARRAGGVYSQVPCRTSLRSPASEMETTVHVMWIVGGIGALVAIACVVVVAWRSEGEDGDLGSVSNQWVSEHRLGQSSHDSQR
jgi:hypothetical protein